MSETETDRWASPQRHLKALETIAAPETADRAQLAAAGARRIMEIQRSTIPADRNIGPTSSRFNPDHHMVLRFRRQLLVDNLRACIRNIGHVLELDDDPDLRGLEAALDAWVVHLDG